MSRPRCCTPPARRAGFTIVEVVLAMFVLLVGMTSILAFLSFGAAMARTAMLRDGAAGAADAVVADLEESLFPLVLVDGREVAGEPRAIEDRPVPGHPGLSYSARATPNPADTHDPPLEYRVDVEMSWTSSGSRRTRSFSTLLLREVPFGVRMRRRFVQGIEPAPAPSTPQDRKP